MHAMTSVPWQRSDVALHNTNRNKEQTGERMLVLSKRMSVKFIYHLPVVNLIYVALCTPVFVLNYPLTLLWTQEKMYLTFLPLFHLLKFCRLQSILRIIYL